LPGGSVCNLAEPQRIWALDCLRETPVDQVVSPERALSALRSIQTHRITLNDQRSLTGISTLDAEQTGILASLRVKKPTSADQYVNL
jgi:hypothetical protein